MKDLILKINIITAILLCLFVSVSDTNAQTSKRKKRVNPPPVVSTTQTTPSVANREYIDGNQIVLGEIPQTQPATEPALTELPAPAVDENTEMKSRIKELNSRIKKLETNKESEYDEKQKRLALNLDILTKAESRAESLRKQLFEMVEKESTVQTRIEQIDGDSRSEAIDRTVAMMGSLRPEEIRDQRKKSLEAEKRNLESLLIQIQTSRANLQANVERADLLVEKIRLKLDKDIDDALSPEEENQ